jgi:two-component system sensor histidine kinase UhpB
MKWLASLSYGYQRWMFRFPILYRVLIGNSFVIICGAIAGTILTRHLTLVGNLNLILLFSFFGILLTLLVNYWIIKTALAPLFELRNALEHVKSGQTALPEPLLQYEDPEIHRLVIAINSMLARLENRTLELQAISERAITAQEEERVRIARGLHDETAQSISMLIIHLEQIASLLPEGNPALQQRVIEVRQLATRLLEDLRKVIWDLRPSILDDLGLVPAIRWYARTNLGELGVQVNFETINESMRLPPHIETMLFRVTQEAVSNILRHAEARVVDIWLGQENEAVVLEIRDDGRGFDVERISGQALSRKQLGLLGIQERVSLVGGDLKVDSAPGTGTRLYISVPILGVNSEGKVPSLETTQEQVIQP